MTRIIVTTAVLAAAGAASAAAEAPFTMFPEGGKSLTVLREGAPYMELAFSGWGPKWSWMGFRGKAREEDGKTHITATAKVNTGAKLTAEAVGGKTGPKKAAYEIELSTSKDTDLTQAILSVTLGRGFGGGKVLVTGEDGKTRTVKLPLGRGGLGDAVKELTYVDGAGGKTALAFEPATEVTTDGDMRITLARKLTKGEPVKLGLTIELPGELTYYAAPKAVPQTPGFDAWYTFRPTEDYAKPSELDMSAWLDAPAGKHGRIVRKDDKLIYNGKPLKLWGLNVCYSSCAPEKDLADRRAAFYARYGLNAVRLHKYADGPGWAGIQSAESFVKFDPEGLERLDYFIAKLKKKGIFVKLSSTFGVKLGPADRDAVPYMDEFGKLKGGKGRVKTGHGSVFLSRELQDLQIAQVVNILEHKNPHTGLTYAEDPAVAVVELFNEDSALFYGTMGRLQKIPTLRKRAGRQFFQWLKQRYGTEQKLLAAWGKEALNSFQNEGLVGESWEEGYIVPAGNPWFYDPAQLAGSQAAKKARLLDTMRFLYEIQNDFYDRYVQAIRKAGYEGEIIASNWQAGRAFSHYYNLHSDARVGMIDRHNYFGGGSGQKINNVTMLRVPGSGMLSAGMQQVADHPFMLSEWIHVLPNEWGVEGPAILGAYGMGLNGWDVSFIFQNRDDGGFLDRLQGRWEVSAPQVMGVFPAVSRQVLRGDVRESDVVAARYVHVPSLHEGKLGFEDSVTQQHDVKTFDSDKVPARSLAVARCVVDFTDTFRPTPTFPLGKYVDDGLCTAATGQLRWREGKTRLDGHITIDTPATKAVVGFAEGVRCKLGKVAITPQCRYAAVYVTARGPEETIDSAEGLLIVAIARARNTGMKVLSDVRILDAGKAPVVMEPVKAAIRIDRPGEAAVHVLDHDGGRTGKTLPIEDGTIAIDGARDKTCYYLVTFGK